MTDGFFETIHKAKPQEPYIRLNQMEFHYLPHYHKELEVVWLRSGQMTVTVDGMDTLLEAGDIFTITPGRMHSMASCGTTVHYIIKLCVPEELLGCQLTRRISPNSAHYEALHGPIAHMADAAAEQVLGYRLLLAMHANQFLFELLQLPLVPMPPQEKSRNQQYICIAAQIADYLEAHYSEPITLDDLCACCAYSRYYISRSFKEITSMSFSQLLASFRVEKAKSMLRSGTGIAQTSFDCGFGSLRSFHRSFRRCTGQSPHDWLQASQADAE